MFKIKLLTLYSRTERCHHNIGWNLPNTIWNPSDDKFWMVVLKTDVGVQWQCFIVNHTVACVWRSFHCIINYQIHTFFAHIGCGDTFHVVYTKTSCDWIIFTKHWPDQANTFNFQCSNLNWRSCLFDATKICMYDGQTHKWIRLFIHGCYCGAQKHISK